MCLRGLMVLLIGVAAWSPAHAQKPPLPKVAISACLLGCNVRYDGRNKHQPDLIAALRKHVQLVPVCPESWLGVPRPPIRLERRRGNVRLIMPSQQRDLTASMRQHNRALMERLDQQQIMGCVLKAGSPTCGIRTTKILERGRVTTTRGSGTLAHELLKRRGFPMADERQLQQEGGVERFVQQVIAYSQRKAQRSSPTLDSSASALVE